MIRFPHYLLLSAARCSSPGQGDLAVPRGSGGHSWVWLLGGVTAQGLLPLLLHGGDQRAPLPPLDACWQRHRCPIGPAVPASRAAAPAQTRPRTPDPGHSLWSQPSCACSGYSALCQRSECRGSRPKNTRPNTNRGEAQTASQPCHQGGCHEFLQSKISVWSFPCRA